jgi:15-cis-phytoene synthase
MVNFAVRMIDNPLRNLALSYAPAERRGAVAALLALDEALGNILRTTREPMVGQMRLAWWREALERLDTTPPPGEPVLTALAGEVLLRGVTGARLATMVDGWEQLLGEPGEAALSNHAKARVELFAIGVQILGANTFDPRSAGQGWALADLAANLGDPVLADRARSLAKPLLDEATKERWPRRARSLGALVHIARMQIDGPLRSTSVLRLGWHRLTGR